MDSNCSEYKGSFEPHKINKNDNYAGSLEMRNINTSNPETMGSGPSGKLVNANVNMGIEAYWGGIEYTQDERCSTDPNCNGQHGTCVLASFAIAAYPFVKKPVFEYFRGICKYYKVDLNTGICPECYCSNHWGCHTMEALRMQGLSPHGDGYKTLWMLIERLDGVFEECRNSIDRSYHSSFSEVENLLRDGCTSIVSFSFYNERKDIHRQHIGQINDAHSIAVAYSRRKEKFIVRDPHINEVKQYNTMADIQKHCKDIYGSRGFSGLGECIVLKKRIS